MNVNFNENDRRSRYKVWQDLRNLKDYRDYKRSNSRAGMWKNSYGNYR
jgi:hypothetical protein